MKNSKLRRILLTLACAVLLVSLSVGATLAYLTSTTGVVTNTFTVGKVVIDLDEAKVDEYGVEVAGADRVKANEYKLLPGHVYTKDPTVTVAAKSEDCYVRMIVTIEAYDALTAAYGYNVMPEDLVNGTWAQDKWPCATYAIAEDGKTATFEFWYADVVEYSESATTLEALFEEIKLDGAVVTETNITNLQNVKINIIAHAIQEDGFATAEEAWAAFGTQN